MKKYILLFLDAILFSVFVRGIAYAQPTQTTTKSAPMNVFVQYDLAFPGILPAHPFYKVKVFRDKLRLVITSDPKKRIDLLLHFADKGILASAMLVDKNQWKKAVETAFKAEHNMTLLTPELYKLEEPIDQALLKKLQTASLKHQEVLLKLRERVPPDDKAAFSQIIDFSKRNQSEIEKYIE